MTLKWWWNMIRAASTSEDKNDRWKIVTFLLVTLQTHSELFPKALTSMVLCPSFCQTTAMSYFSWGVGSKISIVRFTGFSSSFTSLPLLLFSPLLIHLLSTVLQQQWLHAPAMSFSTTQNSGWLCSLKFTHTKKIHLYKCTWTLRVLGAAWLFFSPLIRMK